MADADLKKIANLAQAMSSAASELATELAQAGSSEAAKMCQQCAKLGEQIVKQVPAAPGRDPEPDPEPDTETEQDDGGAAEAAGAPPERGRTPYAQESQSLQREVARKKQQKG